MSLDTQINKVQCGSSGDLGTGLAGCRIDRKRVVGLGLLQRGFKFTAEIDKALMRTLQQNGTLVILNGVVSFEDATPDPTVITRAGSGIKTVAGVLPYEYNLVFDNGVQFSKALSSLSGYAQFDIILFDVDGTLWFTQSKSGEVKGFSLGMFQLNKYLGSDGTNASSENVMMQLTDRPEIDDRMSYITADQLDFTVADLGGVNEVVISADPVAAAATSVLVSVMLTDKVHPVLGLLPANFKVTVNGTALTIAAAVYDPVTMKYNLTIPAATSADVMTIGLNGIVLTTSDDLYKSSVADTVVVA